MISLGLILLGLVLLVGGGELLLRGAVTLATLARVTPAVIGLTVVAAGTSAPEMAVSLIAALRDQEAVAVGNVVGSNILNLTFILGLTAILRPISIGGNTIRLEYPVLVFVTICYLVVSNDGSIGRVDAAFFIAIYIAFTAYMIGLVRRQMNAEEAKVFQGEVEELAQAVPSRAAGWISIGLVAAGVALLTAGAHATVTGAVELGRLYGMSERLIGLTIVAVGTGLPEIVTSLVSSIRGRDDVAIGNVIGSNLLNILGALGLGGLVSPVQVPREIITSDNLWLLGFTLLLFPVIFTGRRVNRWEGAGLLGLYGIYMGFLLGRAH